MIQLVKNIREGEFDCNNSQLFFSKLLKALLIDLNKSLKIRDIPVPHMIINTGDDVMWLMAKGYNNSIEPCDISNENWVYNVIPRCIVNPTAIDMVPDQLTSPYVRGNFQIETEDGLYSLNGEFRRFPVRIQVELKYIFNNFHDVLEMSQHVCTKLAFIRTYKFEYLGQTMIASYKIPESIQDNHLTEISGDTTDPKNHTIDLSIEVESNIPVFNPKTVTSYQVITQPVSKLKLDNGETIVRNVETRPGIEST